MKFYKFKWNEAEYSITEDDSNPPIIMRFKGAPLAKKMLVTDALHMLTAWREAGKPGEIELLTPGVRVQTEER